MKSIPIKSQYNQEPICSAHFHLINALHVVVYDLSSSREPISVYSQSSNWNLFKRNTRSDSIGTPFACLCNMNGSN